MPFPLRREINIFIFDSGRYQNDKENNFFEGLRGDCLFNTLFIFNYSDYIINKQKTQEILKDLYPEPLHKPRHQGGKR